MYPNAVRKSAMARNTKIARPTVRTSLKATNVKMISRLPMMEKEEERMVV